MNINEFKENNKRDEKHKNTREQLKDKQKKYAKILSEFSLKSIEKAFSVLEERRKRVKQNIENTKFDLENLDEETKRIFELMEKYKQEIKQIFISNGKFITHITSVSPDKMVGGKIVRSVNRADNYETRRGDWVFASSSPIDGKNPYMARDSHGMVLIYKNIYIYGDDNIQIKQDEQGKNRVLLKNPNYIYKINPADFRPVVTLMRDSSGKPFFEFSEEWICDKDIDINDSKTVLGVQKVTDITELIENFQVLCDVNITGEAMKIRSLSSKEEAIQMLFSDIKNGNLRYINGEAKINVSEMIENSKLENAIGKATIAISVKKKDEAKNRERRDEQDLQQSIKRLEEH